MTARSVLWLRLAQHYRQRAIACIDEGKSFQLACLVLAEHCAHTHVGDCGGPARELVELAEASVGSLDDQIAVQLRRGL